MNKSKLINSGSYGCVFYPKINCDKQKNKSNANTNSKSKKATKLLITDDTIKKEFEINKYIHNNIPEYYKWTIVWNEKCNSPNYQTLKKLSEIDKCIDPKKKKKNLNLNNNTKFSLLQGLYGGKSSKYFMDKEFNKSVFNKQSLFNTQFIKLMKTCESLFLGISELSKNNLCHHDLNVRNILFNEDKFILIDYGLSFFLNDTESVLKRMNVEFFSDRIYESYPFEYLYYPKYNHKDIISEQEEIALNVHRNNYSEIYKFIHHDLYKRDTDNIRFEMLEDKIHNTNKHSLNKLLKSLDVYSLGMMIFILLIDKSAECNISSKQLLKLLQHPHINMYIQLLKEMTETHYKNRITADKAYQKFDNLF